MRKAILFAALLAVPSFAHGAEPFVRTTVEGTGAIVAGQQVLVDVDVYVPDFFTSPPQFPLFDLPNALVTLPDVRSQNLTETIDGVQYTGIRKTYAIVPQVSGAYTSPAFGIEFGRASDGKQTKATVNAPAVSFDVKAVAGEEQQVTFAASNLVVEQSFDPDARSMKVGDALTRMISITAQDTQAMMIPPLDPGDVVGLHRYENAPAIQDGIALGRNTASRRTETFVYTAEREGAFVLPEVSYSWFDVSSHESKSASLPAMTINVSAALSSTAEIKPVLEDAPRPLPYVQRQKAAIAIVLLLAVSGLLWIGYRALPTIRSRIDRARERRRSSYSHCLKELRKTILTAPEMEVYNALQQWSRHLGFRTLEMWARAGSAELSSQVETLSRKLFKQEGGNFDRKALASAVDVRKTAGVVNQCRLPPLNPEYGYSTNGTNLSRGI
ncbi:BatD family protein [Rhizobium sp. Rhizsp42]|uniref:BatD family protein n=1 Tax=Rhizobium sp. Rhizsp42 TaxID=3243034 RepID=UPI000DD6E70A